MASRSVSDGSTDTPQASLVRGRFGHRSALAVVPFYGDHQAGITTPQQERLMFAALDVTTTDAA